MFDFLTLSVVIDDRIFCVHGGKTPLDLFAIERRPTDAPAFIAGLSPSIHCIDQIKVLDRFRGRSLATLVG